MRQLNPVEVWGGVETTCNRVRDRYIDQLSCSGHATRPEDLDLFAELGLRTLRYGLLWERHEREPNWQLSDRSLARMQHLGIRPISGLVHHGSGPAHTGLLDPGFPEKLARYAAAVAQRYPWIDAYTPVNEPHTTARFSGLYGVWYPHHMSRHSYLTALVHQLQGTVLSMAAIRRVNPAARLIQTEDVGRIWTTSKLRRLGETLDHRRWLAFDLLCGRVDRMHPLFRYMLDAGIAERQILWFQDHPCPPEAIGINYYLTSDRFLDHRVELYPARCRSAEGRFVDVEAVRLRPEGIAGFRSLLMEAWHRYRIPVALTEAHLGGPVDDQIRWVAEAWQAAQQARAAGADCIAVTIWALLGSHYWNELVTRENGHYEPGVFDVSSGLPVRSELADIVAQIAQGDTPQHACLAQPGWWKHPDRIIYGLEEDSYELAAPAC